MNIQTRDKNCGFFILRNKKINNQKPLPMNNKKAYIVHHADKIKTEKIFLQMMLRFFWFDPIGRYKPLFPGGNITRGCFDLNYAAENSNIQLLPAYELEIKMPDIPRSFIANDNAKRILAHAVDEFGFEEQQVIYYYCYLSVPIHNIAWLLEMTELHVASVLGLYCARITDLLAFFKKALPHDNTNKISIKAILT